MSTLSGIEEVPCGELDQEFLKREREASQEVWTTAPFTIFSPQQVYPLDAPEKQL